MLTGDGTTGSRWRLWAAFVIVLAVSSPAFGQTITVVAGTYGGNVSMLIKGNDTARLAAACNGKAACTYVVNVAVIGDPFNGLSKSYVAEWRCGLTGMPTVTIPPEANGAPFVLSCSAPPPLTTPVPVATPTATPTGPMAPPRYNVVTLSCVPPMAPCVPYVWQVTNPANGVQIVIAPPRPTP